MSAVLHLELQADVGSIPLARRHVVAYCRSDVCSALPPVIVREGVGLGELVALLISELVANAVLHSGGSVLSVDVDCSSRGVWVGCTDQSPVAPVAQVVGPDALGGRGVALIEALSTDWGVEPVEGGGKRVWFHLGSSDGS